MTMPRYRSVVEWYGALDETVAEISEHEGSKPIASCYEAGGHVAYADWLVTSESGQSFLAVVLSDELARCEQYRHPVVATSSTGERPEWWPVDGLDDCVSIDDERTWAWNQEGLQGGASVAHFDAAAQLYTVYTLGEPITR